MTTYYKDYSTLGNGAPKVWRILIGYAHRRQTISHGKLARLNAAGAQRCRVVVQGKRLASVGLNRLTRPLHDTVCLQSNT